MTAERPNGGQQDAIEREILRRRHADVPEKMAFEPVEIRERDPEKNFEIETETKELPGESSVRFDDEGTLFIRRYPEAVRGKLTDPPKKVRGKEAKVVFEDWAVYPHVERAIRASGHTADVFDRKNGTQPVALREIVDLVRDLSLLMQREGLTEDDFRQAQEDAAKRLISTKYPDARLARKTHIVDEIMQALDKDRKGRRNRPGSRWILAHLYPKMTKNALINRKTENKYRRIEVKLLAERQKQRSGLETLVALSGQAMSLEGIEFRDTAEAVRRYARLQIDKDTMKFAPYSGVAAKSRFLLLSDMSEEDFEKLSVYIGKEEAERFRGRTPFRQMDVAHQKTRLKEVSDMLSSVLLEGDTNLVTSSSDWVWQDKEII